MKLHMDEPRPLTGDTFIDVNVEVEAQLMKHDLLFEVGETGHIDHVHFPPKEAPFILALKKGEVGDFSGV